MKKTLLSKFFGLIVYIVLFIAGYKVINAMFGKGDYWAHYQFSQELLALSHESLKTLLARVEFPHIISYPIWHIVTLAIQAIIYPIQSLLTSPKMIIGVVVSSVSTSLFLLAAYYVHKKYFLLYLSGRKNEFICRLFAFTILFVGPWYVPLINTSYYLGQGILTAWHNPTHIAVKFIAVLCFYICAKLFEEKLKKNWSIIVKLGLLLVISAFIKPSFYQMFVPGLALYCLFMLIRSKGKKFITCVKAALAVIPVCVVAIIQVNMSFGSPGGGIGIDLGRVIKIYTEYPVLSMILFMAFPIFVLIVSVINGYRDNKLYLAWCAFLSGWGQYMLFFIKGDGWWKADFAWGYYLAVELVFAASVIAFWNIYNKSKSMVLNITGWGIYSIHVFCGLLYYCSLLSPDASLSGEIRLDYIQFLLR